MFTTTIRLPEKFDPASSWTEILASPQREVLLVFAPTRARLLSSAERGLSPGASTNVMHWNGRDAESVEVDSLLERPELVKIVVAQGNQSLLAFVPKGGACTADSSSFWLSSDPAVASAFTQTDYVHALRALLAEEPALPLARYRRFFFELDQRAEPDLRVDLSRSECDDLERNIDRNAAFLAVRESFSARLKSYHARPGARNRAELIPFYANNVGYVTSLFERVARDCFPRPSLGIELDELEDAIEMFANGELRLRIPGQEVWCTQPSSGSFHFFAELALLALSAAPRDPLWLRLANVFVRAQRMHARVYAPRGEMPAGGWTRFEYTACGYSSTAAMTGTEKQALRKEYAGFDFDDLCRAASHQAWTLFPGERS